MKPYALFFLLAYLLISGRSTIGQDNVVNYVNPFIGTDQMGHCFPGATVPFGMVQLSPDTDTVLYSYGKGYNKAVYQYCAGYQYNDPTIVGFSHTHFSGTGHSDLGDFLIMPTVGQVRLNPGTASHPESGYRSRYKKESEKASPGYYCVNLMDYDVFAELTATCRVGHHRYTYPETEQANIILDLVHGIYNYDGKVVWASVRVENDTLITGYRQTNGWARQRMIYFAMSFSKPISSYGLRNDEVETYRGFWRRWKMDDNFPERSGRKIKAHFTFNNPGKLEVKLAVSGVSTEGAMKNLLAEAAGSDFDQTLHKAQTLWQKELNRIKLVGKDELKVNFYTALYHACLSPTTFMDIDGRYRGLDGNVHKAEGFTNYTVFSLWDTFRALHPLWALLKPTETGDMITSMLEHAKQSVHGLLPVWSHHAQDNWCMIGYHSTPVIVDAYSKGIRNFQADRALQAMIRSSTYPRYEGIPDYLRLGYVPAEKSNVSASVTLEYAYDDWCVHRMASLLGADSISNTYASRAKSYRNVWDAKSGFARPRKMNGEFVSPFDPLDTHGQGFIEGNSWTYSLFVPHDVEGLIKLSGGRSRFIERLDSLFTMHLPEKYYEETEDIEKSGIMGNYVHGNEPGHHIPYLYMYAGAPWKTQSTVHKIMRTMYRNAPDGLCGNDDAGQMSAWYIFSALGFYPVCPGSGQYVIGSPLFQNMNIELENGRVLNIRAEGLSEKSVYIQSVTVNGKTWDQPWFPHSLLNEGGEIIFRLSSMPNKRWGTSPDKVPFSQSQLSP